MSIYEPWMEPGGDRPADPVSHSRLSSSQSQDFDPYKMEQDVKVDRKKSVPQPKKSGATGKYRFHDLYRKDVELDVIIFSMRIDFYPHSARPRARA